MPMFDLHNNNVYDNAVDLKRVTDNTASVGDIIDLANYNGCEFIIFAGTLADADMTIVPLLEEGDESDLSDNASVADADLIGTESGATLSFDDDNKIAKLGYKGSKRYVRLTLTPANNTGNADFGAIVHLAGRRKLPQSTQEN